MRPVSQSRSAELHYLEVTRVADSSTRIVSSYLSSIFHPEGYKRVVDRVVQFIERHAPILHFDAIAFRGVSGAAVAFPVALRTGKSLLCVRKDTEDSHAGYQKVEGNYAARRYVIVDDQIATGDTIRAIRDEIAAVTDSDLVGIILWVPDPFVVWHPTTKDFESFPTWSIGDGTRYDSDSPAEYSW